jgi:hypothetical protein
VAELSKITVNSGHVDLSTRVLISTTLVGSPAAGSETSIATVTVPGALSTALGVIVIGWAAFTVGTNGVSAQLRVYHGTTAGTKIGDSGAVTAVAANLASANIIGFDSVPTLPNQVYTLSLTVGSGSAVSTVSAVRLVVLVI